MVFSTTYFINLGFIIMNIYEAICLALLSTVILLITFIIIFTWRVNPNIAE